MTPRRIARICAWTLGGLLLLIVGGIAVVLVTFDPESQKPRIIEAVRQATGRELQLKGRIGLALSLRPTLEVRDVVFANPPGYSRPEMATLEKLDLRLAIVPLLSRRVEIERLIVTKPDIRLETNAAGQPNWVFTPANDAPKPETGKADAAKADGGKGQPLAVAVGEVRLDQGLFSYRDGKTGKLSTLTVKQIATRAVSLDAPLRVTAALALEGADIAITAETGAISALGTGPSWPVKLTVEVASSRIGLEGNVTNPLTTPGLDLALAADIPDLTALGVLAGQALPPLKAIALRARMTGDPKGVALRDLTFKSSAADLAGEVGVALGTVPSVTANLRSDRIDADAILGTGKPEAAPAKSGAAAPSGTPSGGKKAHLIPDDPLPFSALKLVNADARLAIGTLRFGGEDYKTIQSHLVLRDGALTLDPVVADLPQGHVGLTLTADAAQAVPPVHVTLHAPGIAVQGLLKALKQPAYMTGNLEVLADLSGAGQSAHAIAASLDGRLGLAVPGGTIDMKSIGGSAGGVLQTLNPKILNSNPDALRCVAVRLDFVKGLGTFHALVLGSGLANVDGGGTVNLADETLALNLRSQAVVAGAAVTVPVRVSGPIAAPQTKVDQVGIASANAGALAGSVGSLLGADKVLGSHAPASGGGDACPAGLALARGQAAPAPAPASGPAEVPAAGTAAPGTTAPSTAPAPAAQPKPANPSGLLRQLFR